MSDQIEKKIRYYMCVSIFSWQEVGSNLHLFELILGIVLLDGLNSF